MPGQAFAPTGDNTIGSLTRVNAKPFTASSVSPQTATFTLPNPGIWLVTAAYLLAGATTTMAEGTWIVYFATVSPLATDQLGTSKFSTGGFTITGLTLSAPTSGGVVTATCTWGDAAAHAAQVIFTARLLNGIAQFNDPVA